MKKLLNKFREERGQAMVIVALGLVALLGITAFSVDLGMAYNDKAKLQAAADAAALAGAQDLPKPFDTTIAINTANEKAKDTAILYAGYNGVQLAREQVVPGYSGDRRLIQVTCTRQHEYFFARIFGFDSTTIMAVAVAERRLTWGGETLPFMNIDDPYTAGTESDITLWEKTVDGAGDFESLYNVNDAIDKDSVAAKDEFEFDGKQAAVTRCFLNGFGDGNVTLKNGGTVGIETEVKTLVNMWDDGEYIYVLSLREIPENPQNYINGLAGGSGKTQSADIPLSDIVLLKCQIISSNFGSAGDRGIVLHYDGSTPINLATAVQQGTYIPGFVNHNVSIKLVK